MISTYQVQVFERTFETRNGNDVITGQVEARCVKVNAPSADVARFIVQQQQFANLDTEDAAALATAFKKFVFQVTPVEFIGG